MFRQKEPDSNEVLGLKPVCLCVPEELWATATQINQSMIVPGGSFGDANPFYHYFGEKNENIHVLPFATDTNNWYLFGDPNELEMVEVGFMDGNETPQILVADLPAVGAMFDGDRIRMRLRYEYGCEMLSWEGCYGALVP
jgi:hypothetical protein